MRYTVFTRRGLLAGMALGAAMLPAGLLAQQSPEAFFGANDITIIVATGPGGGYDSYARLVAEHWGRFIPGNPNIVVQNMPGAGGRVAAQYMYSIAPKDGSYLAFLQQSFAMDAALGATEGVDDPASFIGIGRLTANYELGMSWGESGIATFEDTLEQRLTLGSTGAASPSSFVPRMLNDIEGAQYEVIQGYEGTAAARLAMESGEVDSIMTGLAGLRSTNPDWLEQGTVNILWQLSNTPHPDYPDVVVIGELGNTETEQAMFRLVGGAADIGRPIIAPPQVPEDRVEALREAFTAMVGDADFLAAAQSRNLEIDPATGAELQEFIVQQSDISEDVIELTRSYVIVQ